MHRTAAVSARPIYYCLVTFLEDGARRPRYVKPGLFFGRKCAKILAAVFGYHGRWQLNRVHPETSAPEPQALPLFNL